MTRRLTRAEIADAVFAALSQSGLSIEEGCAATGLSAAQWHAGLGHIRTLLDRDAITWDAAGKYTLADGATERYIALHVARFLRGVKDLYSAPFVPEGLEAGTHALAWYGFLDQLVAATIKTLAGDPTHMDGQVSQPRERMRA